MLSRKAKYALIATLNLARYHDRGPRLIAEIVEEEQLPRKFAEAILLELKNGGLLDSKKGKGGGYTLARHPTRILAGEVIRIIDGPLAPVRCASVTSPIPCEECRDPATCSIRIVMTDVRNSIAAILDTTTIADMLEQERAARENTSASFMYHI
jgi:Rrf2 family protein